MKVQILTDSSTRKAKPPHRGVLLCNCKLLHTPKFIDCFAAEDCKDDVELMMLSLLVAGCNSPVYRKATSPGSQHTIKSP